jgi:ankyrin repeat protein
MLLDIFLHSEPYGPFNMDCQNDDGDTALHLACRGGSVQSCKLLMKVLALHR